jgi:hypothetical protein
LFPVPFEFDKLSAAIKFKQIVTELQPNRKAVGYDGNRSE